MGDTGISVVITTCDRPAEILQRAYDSVLAQTLSPDEIIIINAGESSLDISLEEGTFVVGSPGAIPAIARNIGIFHSKGEFIAFLDDDDVWYPNKLQDQMSAMEPGTGIVCSPYLMDDRPFPIVEDNILRTNWIGSTSFPLIRRKALDEVGGFDICFRTNQEWDLWMRICSRYFVAVTKEIVGVKESRSDSLSSDIDKRISGWMAIFEVHWEEYTLDRRACRDALGTFRYEMLVKRSLKGLLISESMLWKFRFHRFP